MFLYGIILLIVFFAVSFFVLFKKKTKQRWKFIVIGFLFFASCSLLFFTSFHRFQSEKTAIKFSYPGNSYLETIEGKDSVLVLSERRSGELTLSSLQKNEKGFFFGFDSSFEICKSWGTQKALVQIVHRKNTGDYFCVIGQISEAEPMIMDSLGSQFQTVERRNGKKVYIAVLNGFDENYSVSIS